MFNYLEATTRDEKLIKYLENYMNDRYLFRKFNLKSVLGHSANHILRYPDGSPYAVQCNCGSSTYHRIMKIGMGADEIAVDWDPKNTIKEKNSSLVERRIRELLIRDYLI